MRLSQFPVHTTRETPADAELVSHRLMLRSGMIRRLGTGLYTWMPLGLRVLRRVERIVREEMERAGAVELLMPSIQPAELWQESGRWERMGEEMLRIRDRHGRDYCYGPTHEEVICHHVRQDIRSYRQLPVNYFQIQTKFRDEIRPRFGVMRAREFLMKDAYSFHMDADCLARTYGQMREAYQRILQRIGVDFRVVRADSGNIGGAVSEEFHVLAGSGEDLLAVSDGGYAANVEAAETLPVPLADCDGVPAMRKVPTPGVGTIEELVRTLSLPPERCLKTIVVHGSEAPLVAIVLRGDHQLNEVKAARHPAVASPLRMADEDEIRAAFGAGPGSLGPVNCPVPVLVDHAALGVAGFACGANRDGEHYVDVCWGRDLLVPETVDLRTVVEGDPAPDGSGPLRLIRGIEVGHIFQLGRKYTEAMGVRVLDAEGSEQVPEMGCYGIGVSRLVAAVIEQSHDEHGIIWPQAVAPFDVTVLPIGADRSERVAQAVDSLVTELERAGLDVLVDDRGLRPGVMFADADLIGIPHRIVVSERGLSGGCFEYRHRRDEDSRDIAASAEAVLEAIGASAQG